MSKRPASADGAVSPPPSKRKLTTSTTSKAVSNFFKPASEKEKDPQLLTFRILHETLLTAQYNASHSKPRAKPVRIAAFDFDDTLITTKSGLKFARGEDDWRWWHASVPTKLKQLDTEGWLIVIISNQAAVSLRSDVKTPKGMRSLNNIKGKVSAVAKALDPDGGLSFYAATGHDRFRKPRVGMWEQVLIDYGLTNHEVDLEASVFVGDAAGRAGDKTLGVKKDHSCSDRDLAANIGIGFQTPEEFFLGEEAKPFTRTFEPKTFLAKEITTQTDESPLLFSKPSELDLVLFCGSPGAGKSTFYWRQMQPLGYERVNQDLLKSRDKCMKVASNFIEEKRSVVVDNTNADIETRQAWITLARKLDIPIRLIHFTASAKLCEHNDTVRALTGSLMNPESRTLLPKMAFSGFTSRYREPTLGEGFQDITKVDFKFEGSAEQRALWGRYWIS